VGRVCRPVAGRSHEAPGRVSGLDSKRSGGSARSRGTRVPGGGGRDVVVAPYRSLLDSRRRHRVDSFTARNKYLSKRTRGDMRALWGSATGSLRWSCSVGRQWTDAVRLLVSETVAGSVSETVTGSVSETVAGSVSETVTGSVSETVAGSVSETVTATAPQTAPTPLLVLARLQKVRTTTAPQPRQHPPPRPHRDSTAPQPHLGPPQPRIAHKRAILPRARFSRAPSLGSNFTQLGVYKQRPTLLYPSQTADSPPAPARSGPRQDAICRRPTPNRVRAKRGPIRRAVAGSRGGVGSTNEPGSSRRRAGQFTA
jgi:hypothetical protein